MAKILFRDIFEAMTMQGALAQKARGKIDAAHLSIQKKQSLVVDQGKIVWMGSQNKIPREYFSIKNEKSVRSNVFPGFIDCHTHTLFAGDRTQEYELKLQGQTYQDIASRGGGILHTVRETRKASRQKIEEFLQKRLDVFLQQGVTTLEVKTGYGLSIKEELRQLDILNQIKSKIHIVPTFLGAHALPPEFVSHKDYIDELEKVLPTLLKKKLTQRLDIFIEKNYFSLELAQKYLSLAKRLGFDLAVHADQLSRTGATELALKLGARSVDHAICVNENDIKALAHSETTAVLLPTADFYMRCPYPPARQMLESGVRIALATDFNPGTSPTQNIQWVGLLARNEMKMSLPEVFTAFTLGGAYALGLEKQKGALCIGYDADFFITDCPWDEFFYDLRFNFIKKICTRGSLTSIP